MTVKETIEANPNIILQISGSDLLQFAHDIATEVREQAIKDTQNFLCEKLLSGKEAAEMCGVGFSTFWRWVKQGKVPQIKGAGKPRYRLSDIQKLITNDNGQNKSK